MTADRPDLDAHDLRTNTFGVLQYLLKLKLPPARWERVAQVR